MSEVMDREKDAETARTNDEALATFRYKVTTARRLLWDASHALDRMRGTQADSFRELRFGMRLVRGLLDSVDGGCIGPPVLGETALSIRDLQDKLQTWGAHSYTPEFQAYGVRHRDFAHALLHVLKAAGKLSCAVDQADHDREASAYMAPERVDRFLADLVVCAVRMANTCPGRKVDLEAVIRARLDSKFSPDFTRTVGDLDAVKLESKSAEEKPRG